MIYVPLCCMSGNVYAFIPLYHDKYYITLAYPCMFRVCSCYVFSFAMITFWWEQMGILLEVGLMVVAVQPSGPVVMVFRRSSMALVPCNSMLLEYLFCTTVQL